MRQCGYINISKVKKYCKGYKRQVSKEFIHDLNCIIERILISACTTWNGSSKRLKSEIMPKKAKALIK